jgi:hypothetical protein
LFTVFAFTGNTREVHMTQMTLIDERTELEIPSAARIGGCSVGLDYIEQAFADLPTGEENEELDELLAARCGSL